MLIKKGFNLYRKPNSPQLPKTIHNEILRESNKKYLIHQSVVVYDVEKIFLTFPNIQN